MPRFTHTWASGHAASSSSFSTWKTPPLKHASSWGEAEFLAASIGLPQYFEHHSVNPLFITCINFCLCE